MLHRLFHGRERLAHFRFQIGRLDSGRERLPLLPCHAHRLGHVRPAGRDSLEVRVVAKAGIVQEVYLGGNLGSLRYRADQDPVDFDGSQSHRGTVLFPERRVQS